MPRIKGAASSPLFSFPVASDGAPDDLTSELAAEIRSAVAQASPAAPPRPEASSGLEGDEDIRISLTRALEHLTPVIPPAARFSGSKRFLLRALRLLWRDQASFNALLLDAGNGLAERLQQAASQMRELEVRLDHKLTESRAAFEAHQDLVKKWSAAWERRGSIQEGRLAMLEAASPARPGEVQRPAPRSIFRQVFTASKNVGSPRPSPTSEVLPPFLDSVGGPVLDVGCGRGSSDAAARARHRASELKSTHRGRLPQERLMVEQETVSWRSGRKRKSLGAVVAFKSSSTEPRDDLLCPARGAARARPGRDPRPPRRSTRILLLPARLLWIPRVRGTPEALQFAEAAGFVEARIGKGTGPHVGAGRAESSENDAKLNRLLFGPQDYALIARVPSATR
jgi:hypothetical protein